METGFYWVGRDKSRPQVWFWYSGYGFYGPMDSVPLTMAQFEEAEYKVLSKKLTAPELRQTA